MRYALGMLTFDRSPAPNYLGETLANFFNSFKLYHESFELHLFDSGSPDPAWLYGLPGVHHFPERRLTPNENAVALLRGCSALECDWVIFLEDDIDFCADFLIGVDRWLEQHEREDRHIYTFHTPYREVLRAYERGQTAWDYPISGFYGTQCLAMRREVAAEAAEGLAKLTATWESAKGYDLILKAWARERWPDVHHFLASAPCFVQHVGLRSSIGSGFHENQSWPGRQWSYQR